MIKIYDINDFPSRQSVDGQFMLEKFEDLQRPPDLKWPHKHSFYEILWLTSGSSVNVVDYHQTKIDSNTLFFMSPGQVHMMSTTKDVKGYSVTFTEEFIMLTANNMDRLLTLSFLDSSTEAPYLKLDSSSSDELKDVIAMMENEVSRPIKSGIILSHLLFVLLNKIQRIVDRENSISDHSNVIRVKQLKKYIEENFREHRDLPFYAEKLSLTSHRLNQICKEVTARTAGELIRDRVNLEIKRLLVHSDWSIGEISEYLGFEDISYFSRQFKKRELVSPMEFRKKMSEKYQNL